MSSSKRRGLSPLALITICLLAFNSTAKSSDATLSSYLLPSKDASTLQRISDQFEIVRRTENGFEIIVPTDRAKEFLALAPEATLIEEDIDAKIRDLRSRWQSGYHDFTSVENEIQKLATEHSDLVQLIQYGHSQDGRALSALRISQSSTTPLPKLMITAATHGDEIITVEVLLGFINKLIEDYPKDAHFSSMIKTHELFFIPVVNPDGYANGTRYANGVDPNRDYPSPQKPNDHPNECISSIISFFQQHDIKGTLDFHAYGGLVMYPWAYTYTPPESPDKEKFELITSAMAKLVGFRYGQIAQFTFPVTGSSADYYYWKNKTLALGIEVADDKAPDPALIPQIVQGQELLISYFVDYFK